MKSASLLLATVVTAISPFVAVDGHQWAYTESNTTIAGPSHWSTYYPACGGSRQSPIDISTKACGRFDEAPLSFSGECPNFELSQTPEAFKGAVNGGSCTVQLDELTYNLLQFHVHLPSEHTLNGNTFDGEAHFVHNRTDGGELLVIGVFLEASDDAATNDFFSDVLYAMDTVDKAKPAEVSLSAYSNVILSTASGGHLFNYPGSLTTPGCNEIVDWWVVQKPLKIATSDLERLQKYFQRFEIYDEGKDARSVQPLNGRTITTYKV